MRQLATVRTITEINPIPNADAIEVALLDGWKVVIRKGEFEVGESVVYLEIDSWVPHKLAPFLSKGKQPKEYEGIQGERLRTAKLRGQVSQGLLLKIHYDQPGGYVRIGDDTFVRLFHEDLTGQLGVVKWEPPIPAQMQGLASGLFPTHLIPETDQECVQNLVNEIAFESSAQNLFEVTMKLDGSSCTIFRHKGKLRVCSRNMELKVCPENEQNTFVRMAQKYSDVIRDNIVIQGEVMGPGIQRNREGLKDHELFIFDMCDIEQQRYFTPGERLNYAMKNDIPHVPVINEAQAIPDTVDEILEYADIPSMNHKIAEGLVFKRLDGLFSFKAINNKFLLKGGN